MQPPVPVCLLLLITRRQLNYGFAANSTGATLLSLPSADPLAQVQAAFAEQSR